MEIARLTAFTLLQAPASPAGDAPIGLR